MEPKHVSEVLPIVVWQGIVNQLSYETDGFKLPLQDLTAEELTQIKPVPFEVLQYASKALEIMHPKHHPELRRTVAYLIALHEYQKGAWRVILDKYEAEQQRIKTYLDKRNGRTI